MLNAVQKLSSANNSWIEIVPIFPRPISDNRDGMRIASCCFFGSESTTEDRFYSECVEIIRRYDANGCAFGAVADAQRRTGNAIDDERLKQRRVFFEISEVGIRKSVISGYASRRADKGEHPILMWHQWIRPNQNSFDQTENRRICPDTECEAKQRKNGKSGTA